MQKVRGLAIRRQSKLQAVRCRKQAAGKKLMQNPRKEGCLSRMA